MLVYGHRGARARLPENTLPAFRYAIDQGVDSLELDVLITKDGVPVVVHDLHINGDTCSGPHLGAAIYDLTLEELRECDCGAKRNPLFPGQTPVPGTPIPTLDEVFALGQGNSVRFSVEAKIFPDQPELTPAPEPFARLILDRVRQHGLTRRVTFQSFDPRILIAMKKLDASIPRAALIETDCEWDAVAREFEATSISPEYRLVTKERVAWAHDNGLTVVPWTVNRPEDWAAMAAAGVDAIISDDPAALIGWLKAAC
jgi:glycerophosphoryl diester phosphodiesterase